MDQRPAAIMKCPGNSPAPFVAFFGALFQQRAQNIRIRAYGLPQHVKRAPGATAHDRPCTFQPRNSAIVSGVRAQVRLRYVFAPIHEDHHIESQAVSQGKQRQLALHRPCGPGLLENGKR